jgi:hypothetical protein
MTKVVHCKRSPYDVYIGRPSKWGNPFVVGKDGTREEVVSKYREWIKTQPHLLTEVSTLKDKILGCWCKNNKGKGDCHGDVLAEIADNN